MNFGNPPFFPENQTLICVNGSHEELEFNRAADTLLLSDPGAFFDALRNIETSWPNWFDLQLQRRTEWVGEWETLLQKEDTKSGKMHPLQLSIDVQNGMNQDDWLVFDGGNTHFWAEIGVSIAASQGQQFAGISHPGSYSLLGVGVSLAVSAKAMHPEKTVVLISGDGAFLSGGLSIETAFQENLPIVVVVESREQLRPALVRAIASGKTACLNVKCKGVISPIVAATSDKRDKASIE